MPTAHRDRGSTRTNHYAPRPSTYNRLSFEAWPWRCDTDFVSTIVKFASLTQIYSVSNLYYWAVSMQRGQANFEKYKGKSPNSQLNAAWNRSVYYQVMVIVGQKPLRWPDCYHTFSIGGALWLRCAILFQHQNLHCAVLSSQPFLVDDADTGLKLKLWPVLAYVEGDTPFLSKMSDSVGHAAITACQRCALRGKTIGGCTRYEPSFSSLLKCCKWVHNNKVYCICAIWSGRVCQYTQVTYGVATTSFPCRFPCYHAMMHQHVPLQPPNITGELQHNSDDLQTECCVPRGTLSQDTSIARTSWSPEQVDIHPHTWCSDNQLKYSEGEMAIRARAVATVTTDHEALNPLLGAETDLPGLYLKRLSLINRKHLKIGVKGVPVFSQLSYFRWVTACAVFMEHLRLHSVHLLSTLTFPWLSLMLTTAHYGYRQTYCIQYFGDLNGSTIYAPCWTYPIAVIGQAVLLQWYM